MKITSIKTDKITPGPNDLFKLLDQFLPEKIEESSILAITSKIVAICEGRVVKISQIDKDELIASEAQFYLSREENPYNVSLTITRNNLVAGAGIDESNGNGYYILWPENPQKSANEIRAYLKQKYNLKNFGVIITDSKTTPFRWGVTAICLGYSGFTPIKDYIGSKDLFGRKFQFERMSIIDNLACASSLIMGEGDEQTPMALIEDLPFVEFQNTNPTEEELKGLKIEMNEDLYSPLIKNAPWKKGKA